MSLKRPAKDQPENFEFNSSSLEAANKIISRYPKGKQQSAVMGLLYIAQKQKKLQHARAWSINVQYVLFTRPLGCPREQWPADYAATR